MKNEILNNDAVTVRVNTDAALDAIEETLDIIEGGIDTVVTVTKNNPILLAGIGLVALGIGGFVGYKLAVKRVSAHYEDILEREIAAAKAFHKRLAKDGEFSSPESAVEALIPEQVVEAIQSYQGKDQKVPYNKVSEIEETVEVVEIVKNVFVDARVNLADWNIEHELQYREAHPDEPYIISFEEFSENENSHEQANLSYYAGDDTLTDDRDQPIDNTDNVVGDDNLTRFGHGSHDKNVIYVRNEKLDIDFEVIRSEGSYAKEVLGFIEHSDRSGSRHRENNSRRPENRKFRWADE